VQSVNYGLQKALAMISKGGMKPSNSALGKHLFKARLDGGNKIAGPARLIACNVQDKGKRELCIARAFF
jgi:hypothetical protein